jgi:hypothetical protein
MILSSRYVRAMVVAAFIGVVAASVPVAVVSGEIEQPPLIPDLPADPGVPFLGARIQRTMTLLATSTENHRNPVKILFYGQSITAQPWWELVVDQLRARFPHAGIIAENRSIGGFTAPRLVRTAAHDLYPYHPDLVVFHVYGGEQTGELERIIASVRRYTTADIMVYTHHLAQSADLSSEQHRNRTEAGDRSSDTMRYLAQKYGCEVVDVRPMWKELVNRRGIEPKELLSDTIHLNEDGLKVMAAMVGRHFTLHTGVPDPWAERVRTWEAARIVDEGADDGVIFSGVPWERREQVMIGSDSGTALELTFEGTRVDILPGAPGDIGAYGTARIYIDGRPPSSFPELYEFTLPSTAHTSWMPAIMRVGHRTPLVPETWTLTITDITEDASRFSYEVAGSVTGHDGTGSNLEPFESISGRVCIEPRDFMIEWIVGYFKKPCPAGFEVTWEVQTTFADVYAPGPDEDATLERYATVAAGLPKGIHTLTLVPAGDGPVPVRAVRTHNPPLP